MTLTLALLWCTNDAQSAYLKLGMHLSPHSKNILNITK